MYPLSVFQKLLLFTYKNDVNHAIYLSIYLIESLFVCLLVRGKRQNYGTD